MAIDLGDIHPVAVETTDSSGNLADATTVVLTIQLPDGTTITPAVAHPSLGRYEVDYLTANVGLHLLHWDASGLNASAYADSFYVNDRFPRYLVSLERAKRKLKIPLTELEHDEDLREYSEAATEVVERHCKETVVRRTVTDVYKTCATSTLTLDHTPAISLTSVATVDGVTSWDVANLHLDGVSGIVTVKTGPWLRGHLLVTYVAGRTSIPASYQRAALIIIEHLWQTERGQSVAGPYPGAYEDSMDGMRRLGSGYAIPNRALELLGTPPPMVG